jgi:hypothetical protein
MSLARSVMGKVSMLTILLIMGMLSLMGCIPFSNIGTGGVSDAKPSYIEKIWPEDGNVILVEDYIKSIKNDSEAAMNHGVSIKLIASKIDRQIFFKGIDKHFIPLLSDEMELCERVTLVLNGVLESSKNNEGGNYYCKSDGNPKQVKGNDSNQYYIDERTYILNWRPVLQARGYDAELNILRINGEKFAYKWHFTLDPIKATPTPKK